MKKSITRFAFCAILLVADFARLIAADLVLSAGSGVRVINTGFDGAGENRRWRITFVDSEEIRIEGRSYELEHSADGRAMCSIPAPEGKIVSYAESSGRI